MKPGITPVTAVTSVIVGEANKQINVSGRLSFQGPKETVLTKGKTLQKQEALFTDNTGTVRFVHEYGKKIGYPHHFWIFIQIVQCNGQRI